jgi:hypothetical protein
MNKKDFYFFQQVKDKRIKWSAWCGKVWFMPIALTEDSMMIGYFYNGSRTTRKTLPILSQRVQPNGNDYWVVLDTK